MDNQIPESNYTPSPPLWYELPTDRPLHPSSSGGGGGGGDPSQHQQQSAHPVAVCTVEERWGQDHGSDRGGGGDDGDGGEHRAAAVQLAPLAAAAAAPSTPGASGAAAGGGTYSVRWNQLWHSAYQTSCFKTALFSSFAVSVAASAISFSRKSMWHHIPTTSHSHLLTCCNCNEPGSTTKAFDWFMYSFAGTFVTSFSVCQQLNKRPNNEKKS